MLQQRVSGLVPGVLAALAVGALFFAAIESNARPSEGDEKEMTLSSGFPENSSVRDQVALNRQTRPASEPPEVDKIVD